MFGAGRLPDPLRAQLDTEGVVFLAENLAVVRHFSGSVPGLFSAASVSRTAGAFAVTSQRILATLAVQSDPAALAADCRWAGSERGAMDVELTRDGLKLDVDVHRVDPRFQGRLSMHFEHAVPAEVLAQVPRASIRQNVSAEFVFLALGVRPK